jgi:hypothetical protein
MIVTARQLEDLHRSNGSNGHVTLPYRARLTPLAQDWVRARKIALGYAETDAPHNGALQNAVPAPQTEPPLADSRGDAPPSAPGASAPGSILYWCDGPCGPSKAALVGMEKEAPLKAMLLPPERKWIVAVAKELASEIKAGRASAGVVVVQNAAAAVIYLNRCPTLRAVVGTCLEAVEQGLQQVAANVLVIEHPHKTLPQVKNMLGRFVRAGRRELPEEVRRHLQELATCG